MTMYRADSFEVKHRAQFHAGDPYLLKMRKHWEVSLREASANMPDIDWNQAEESVLPTETADLEKN
jgi:putative proteasome-type protease